MAYADIVQMAQSQSLIGRIAACAAAEGVANPQEWAWNNAWQFAASPGWSDSWAYATNIATMNENPDTGARNDVITDPTILATVQALIAEQNPA